MNEQIWHDQVTGTKYRCEPSWVERVQEHIAKQLEEVLNGVGTADSAIDRYRLAANEVARFWNKSYYRQLFPLRFGLDETDGWLRANTRLANAEEVLLTTETAFRTKFLDAGAWPPILPDPCFGSKGWLQADRLLIEAACSGVALTNLVDEEIRQVTRLSALTYPFHHRLHHLPIMQGDVKRIGAIFQAHASCDDLYKSITTVLAQVRDGQPLTDAEQTVGLVVMSIQRIKQYVFETSGLNEIRGASTLLDNITDELSKEIQQEIGPEVIFRAAGSTLLFMTPVDDQFEDRAEYLRRTIFEKTGTAFATAAAVQVSLEELVNHYNTASAQVFAKLNEDRARAELPTYTTYPFEKRCRFCVTRPAAEWIQDADGNYTEICPVCKTKRETGQPERRGKVQDILVDLGVLDVTENWDGRLQKLGVKGNRPDEWLAHNLDGLIYPNARRKLIGVVYGDGNNFGAVATKIQSIALGLQWTARVEQTTKAAAALALAQATQWIAKHVSAGKSWAPDQAPVLEKVPFQVLAMGGDDISLFAWAPVATYFAAEFTRLTDLELAATSAERLQQDATLHFSVGVLTTDEKTPVQKSIHFAEEELLKWAKRANKSQKLPYGNITTLYAETAEGVPSHIETYHNQTFKLGAKGQFTLCTTMRPYSAKELKALLATAEYIDTSNDLGRLERLVSAFYGARQGAMAGMLYYAYQKGRTANQKEEGWIAKLEKQLMDEMRQQENELALGLLINCRFKSETQQPQRPLFGVATEEASPLINFSPIWDLLELTKMMT